MEKTNGIEMNYAVRDEATGNYLNGYEKPVCGHCGLQRTAEGHDGCLGTLPGVKNACCGHGEIKMAYVQFYHANYESEPNKFVARGSDAVGIIQMLRQFNKCTECSGTGYVEDGTVLGTRCDQCNGTGIDS